MWEPAEREFDLISELQNFSGKVKIEIQPEGPIAHKIKEGDRTLVEDEQKAQCFSESLGFGMLEQQGPQDPRKGSVLMLGTTGRRDEIPGVEAGGGGTEEEEITWLLHLFFCRR